MLSGRLVESGWSIIDQLFALFGESVSKLLSITGVNEYQKCCKHYPGGKVPLSLSMFLPGEERRVLIGVN